jgi:hypothetical protein
MNQDGVPDILAFGSASIVVRLGSRDVRPSRPFRRGDSNGEGKVDLTDAIATLLYLFSAGVRPPCLDAADADDSGKVEITDAIFLLGALFQGTRSIPEPYPLCGADPTPDEIDCGAGCP